MPFGASAGESVTRMPAYLCHQFDCAARQSLVNLGVRFATYRSARRSVSSARKTLNGSGLGVRHLRAQRTCRFLLGSWTPKRATGCVLGRRRGDLLRRSGRGGSLALFTPPRDQAGREKWQQYQKYAAFNGRTHTSYANKASLRIGCLETCDVPQQEY